MPAGEEGRSCHIGQSEEYKSLNRFRNITTYDDNRVVLRCLTTEVDFHEFINASFIDGYSLPRKFIACQGPLEKTVEDFWHMIWQEKALCVVMLTNLKEGSKNKCYQYWPQDRGESETYGQLKATYIDYQLLLHYIVRTLRVELVGTDDYALVNHYQFTSWPDYGVPDSVSPFMTFHKRIMNFWSTDMGPIVIHCSAGVGRTGTFIAIDIALEQANKKWMVDIGGIITRMREQRMQMVQTHNQYAFIHDAVLEATVVGPTEVISSLFKNELIKWRLVSPKTGLTSIQSQYELLSFLTPNECNYQKTIAEAFPEKNRSNN